MIRINLLGTPKAKSGKKGSAVSMPSMDMGGGGSPLRPDRSRRGHLLRSVNGDVLVPADREKKSIEVQMRLAEQKNRELADIKARYLERQTSGRCLQAPGRCH